MTATVVPWLLDMWNLFPRGLATEKKGPAPISSVLITCPVAVSITKTVPDPNVGYECPCSIIRNDYLPWMEQS